MVYGDHHHVSSPANDMGGRGRLMRETVIGISSSRKTRLRSSSCWSMNSREVVILFLFIPSSFVVRTIRTEEEQVMVLMVPTSWWSSSWCIDPECDQVVNNGNSPVIYELQSLVVSSSACRKSSRLLCARLQRRRIQRLWIRLPSTVVELTGQLCTMTVTLTVDLTS